MPHSGYKTPRIRSLGLRFVTASMLQPLISKDSCQDALPTDQLQSSYPIFKSQMCFLFLLQQYNHINFPYCVNIFGYQEAT